MLLEPKEIVIKTQDQEGKVFVISKFPAVQGRVIIAKYPTSNIPKVGDYATSEETMLKLMAFVGVKDDNGNILPLNTKELLNNHVPDWEALARLEWSMMEYNCSFFGKGLNSAFFESISQKAVPWISRILTLLSAQLSKPAKQPSTNSKPSTHSKTHL
ncbi:hypothetical protein [Bartonella tamiae]|uniref:Uncharacterized protein n=1 Tax=Bartonella tamiae Th239 TaxID=1094558 RepID=J1JVV8_9HYPH|nr:hypothetical protein [Bartonella tamiae]EJF89112.1 hypothetical protein ME5_01663 [Bartonella tamiae Th239]EJF95485.1 hypothetical protein MEG_00218 [Bartonella tamiae Th307]